MKKKVIRDFVVYFLSSVKELLFKKGIGAFVYDLRQFSQWRRYKLSEQNTLTYHIPWMCFSVIAFLKQWLKKEMIVFEYGSGGSTFFLSERVHTVYSIEHDPRWFAEVQKNLSKDVTGRFYHQLVLPEEGSVEKSHSCDHPDLYLSCMGAYKGLRFQNYVQTIDQHPDGYFDLVIIDGRARPSCIQHAIPKIKQGGILLVDNADREYYLQPFPELFDDSKWEEKSFTGHTPFGLTSVLYTTKLFLKK
nr:hypothetical protein [uncultured Lacibacter sp.]